MSQPKSSCDGGPENLVDPEQLSHFHINRPLHPHSIAFLCTLFKGGIEKLLLEQLGNKNVAGWEKVAQFLPDSWGHLKWNVPIHVTGWKFLNCKIPFRYEMAPFYVYRNKKWYLNQCLFQRMRDEMYVLSRKQQNMMKEIKKIKQEWAMDQKVILRAKLNEMKAKNDLIQREKDILKEVNDVWKTREQEWKTRENQLNSKLQGTLRENKILKGILHNKRVDRISSNPWRWNNRVKRLSPVSQLFRSLGNFSD
ncbi:uncharacterized protein TNCV_3568951 [Trichonephila clavipes]|nr:uncharacterized protein TNCV_3568951 [Trichonephila clavipes]